MEKTTKLLKFCLDIKIISELMKNIPKLKKTIFVIFDYGQNSFSLSLLLMSVWVLFRLKKDHP